MGAGRLSGSNAEDAKLERMPKIDGEVDEMPEDELLPTLGQTDERLNTCCSNSLLGLCPGQRMCEVEAVRLIVVVQQMYALWSRSCPSEASSSSDHRETHPSPRYRYLIRLIRASNQVELSCRNMLLRGECWTRVQPAGSDGLHCRRSCSVRTSCPGSP